MIGDIKERLSMSDSTSKPPIGVFVTSYNLSRYLAVAIDSIGRQTLQPDLVIVVDDASTDDSAKIAEQALKGRGFISFVIRNDQNRGPSYSRNVAIKLLMDRGCEFIGQLDGDDFYHPTKLERSVAKLTQFPNAGMVYSDYETLDVVNQREYTELKSPYSFELLQQNCVVSTNSVYRADAFKQCGLFDESMRGGEDYELYLRIAKRFMIYHLAESLFTYRLHGKNITLTNPEQVINNVNDFKRKLAASR